MSSEQEVMSSSPPFLSPAATADKRQQQVLQSLAKTDDPLPESTVPISGVSTRFGNISRGGMGVGGAGGVASTGGGGGGTNGGISRSTYRTRPADFYSPRRHTTSHHHPKPGGQGECWVRGNPQSLGGSGSVCVCGGGRGGAPPKIKGSLLSAMSPLMVDNRA